MNDNTLGFLCGLLLTFAVMFVVHTVYDAATISQIIGSMQKKNCSCAIKKDVKDE